MKRHIPTKQTNRLHCGNDLAQLLSACDLVGQVGKSSLLAPPVEVIFGPTAQHKTCQRGTVGATRFGADASTTMGSISLSFGRTSSIANLQREYDVLPWVWGHRSVGLSP
eukprot:231806-Amphidinium_carterae.1